MSMSKIDVRISFYLVISVYLLIRHSGNLWQLPILLSRD